MVALRRRWRRRVTGPGALAALDGVCAAGWPTSWASTPRGVGRPAAAGAARRTRCPEPAVGRDAGRRAADGRGGVRRASPSSAGTVELARLRAAVGAREVVLLGGVAGAGKSRLRGGG